MGSTCRWAGVALWNNLLEKPGTKTTNWISPKKRFLCPTPKRPYFYTNDNHFEDERINHLVVVGSNNNNS